jgi:hypothetical protein
MTAARRAAVEGGEPLNEVEEAFGYHACPLDQSRVVGPRFKAWGLDKLWCRCGHRLPQFECQCTFHARIRSGGCSICNPGLRDKHLTPPPDGELKWEAYQRHHGEVKRLLLEKGCMDSRGRIRGWKKDMWYLLNMAGHSSLDHQKCICTRNAK